MSSMHLLDILNASIEVLSFELEMSKCSMHKQQVVASQLKFRKYYFMVFQQIFLNKV